ncbi:MAG TPA: dTMP kinase [Candidatus Marinimicrobia bacterium]|nr:dTMP kinase [Candidatus Neomarinimicrobiota bacterium]
MTESTSNGKFITFEGVDGCGKSTQAEKLIDKLAEVEVAAATVREPGGDPISESIRKILLHAEESMSDRAEALLMIASRAQLTDKVILPQIINGKWVVADRYADSTLAYQGGGRGLSVSALEEINNFGTYTLKPDITFFIDIPIEKANERMSVSRDRIESEGLNFQERVRDQYLALNAKEPNRVILINGDQSIDKVFEDIWTAMQEKFRL